ncbi:MAG: ABC transporter ATP-binding protein [Bacteroidia bacterium]|nr:ABC transporter ATP-binding protein [Bacteroidia bacterium]MCF8425478.1 ABC transporter ATP-binding protein [Bacteroidia bacterium]MCF8445894.1 ABC transporter ATP-binding protein [Bacteroidia bacterium]
MIRVENIQKSYGSLPILKGVNLSVQTGEIVSIVGASGAGKTTLLQIIGTLDQADKGNLFIADQNIMGLSGNKLAKFRNKHIGFVFQFHQLLPEFTAIENVCIPGWIGGESETKIKKRAAELLDYLGLSDRISHKPSALSGGEQQRVAVARALINQPSVILADEPSGNLDSHSAEELHQLFFNLRKEFNQTFVIVTHNQVLAAQSDRMLTIKDGVILD